MDEDTCVNWAEVKVILSSFETFWWLAFLRGDVCADNATSFCDSEPTRPEENAKKKIKRCKNTPKVGKLTNFQGNYYSSN